MAKKNDPYDKKADLVLHQAKGFVKYTKGEDTTKVYARIRQYKDFAPKVSVEEEGVSDTGKHWCKRHDKLPLAMVKSIGTKLFALMALAAEFEVPVADKAQAAEQVAA